ncbi:MAG: hypothetical protein P1P73_06750 [Brevefilum sp.]|nr:hypothetical protein [Brevefilum sp.]
MAEKGMNKKPHHYPGVSVFLPDQIDQDYEIAFKDLPKGIVDIPKKFELIRPIGNIALFPKGSHGKPLVKFDPPIELRISYNSEDLTKVGGDVDNLKLAYWDLRQWVVISDPSYDYQILPPSTAKIAEVKIREWADDPTLAWGK